MPHRPLISLDTNIFIFGLRSIDPYSVAVLKNLFQYDARISVQVEKELRNNVSHLELKGFYSLIEPLSSFEIVYRQPEQTVLHDYQKLGLKTGDALIAAFCRDEDIEIFISENRHFLQRLPDQPFEILDSELFCERFKLSV